MQIICTSIQKDNHAARTSSLNFYQRNAIASAGIIAVVVCLSVCPSVCHKSVLY